MPIPGVPQDLIDNYFIQLDAWIAPGVDPLWNSRVYRSLPEWRAEVAELREKASTSRVDALRFLQGAIIIIRYAEEGTGLRAPHPLRAPAEAWEAELARRLVGYVWQLR